MKVEIWSDVVCPWCYVGKRRFEAAVARFPHPVEVQWRSFELDPTTPWSVEGTYEERLGRKYDRTVEEAAEMTASMTATAATEGLRFDFAAARPGGTFDAHRLLHHAQQRGRQDDLKEVLLRATFTEGEAIGEVATLQRLAESAGLDAEEVAAVLSSDAHASDVRRDEERARELGITGVPFYVVDGRYGVSGAQTADLLLEVLQKAWTDVHGLEVVTGPEAACEGDACAV